MPTGHCPKCRRQIEVTAEEVDRGIKLECLGCGARFSAGRPHHQTAPPPVQPQTYASKDDEPEDSPAPPPNYSTPQAGPFWYQSAPKTFALMLAALLTANLITFIAANIYAVNDFHRELDKLRR
jgi:hypothetical protein